MFTHGMIIFFPGKVTANTIPMNACLALLVISSVQWKMYY